MYTKYTLAFKAKFSKEIQVKAKLTKFGYDCSGDFMQKSSKLLWPINGRYVP